MASGLHTTKELAEEISHLQVNAQPTNEQNVNIKDITSKLFAATQSLGVGEVIRAVDFSFLDSLGALEIMDPKTDSGLIVDSEENENHLLSKILLPEEVIWIMDQLLAREISWHSGNPLAQTLFTCPYLVEILLTWDSTSRSLETASFLPFIPQLTIFSPKLTAVVFKNFLIGVIATTRNIITVLRQGYIYEEEDISTNTCMLNLFDGVDYPDLQALIQEAQDIIQQELSTATDENAKTLLEAIETRIEFRRKFAELLSDIGSTKFKPSERKQYYRDLIELHGKVSETMDLGKAIPGAFTTKTQRRLSIHVPPRPMVVLEAKDALQLMSTMLHQLNELEDLVGYNTPHEVINFFDYFAARNPTPFAYVRSMAMERFGYIDTILRRETTDDFLMNALAEISHPQQEYFLEKKTSQANHPTGPNYRIQLHLKSFLARATPIYMDLFGFKAHNKSRQRRNLSSIVQEWEALQLDVERIDTELVDLIPQKSVDPDNGRTGPKHAFPLCSWVYHIKLGIVESVLLMGFELELYQAYEYFTIYGFLEYTFALHHRHLRRIKMHANVPRDENGIPTEWMYIDYLLLRTSAMEALCAVYASVFAVLKALDLLHLPKRDKTNDYMRYSLRLKPFWGLSAPAVMPFETFQESYFVPPEKKKILEKLKEASDLLLIGKEAFADLNKLTREQVRMRYCFDQFKEEMRNLMKSCIAINIFIQGLVKEIAVDINTYNGKVVILENSYHPYFASVKLVEKPERSGQEKK